MPGILERYRRFYDFPSDFPIVSLNEGNTPLIPAPKIAAEVSRLSGQSGLQVFLKFEGLNPTGSFKDRGMTYAVSRAVADGHTHIICASTGNTSAAAAAYGARAGLKTLIILPGGKVALGKLSQAIMYGASIVEIDGNFDQALDIVRALGETGKVCVVNSINPYRLQGQKTGAFEVCDVLGEAPDDLYIPVGNAGNITAYWMGFQEYAKQGITQKLPRMCGYQAEGAAPLVLGHKVEKPETLATAIRIGNPASWKPAESARDESGGRIDCVSDPQIVEAYQFLAGKEGILCEPSSAASVAGLFKAAQLNQIKENSTIVCVLTGNGLKDPDSAIQYGTPERAQLPADPDQVAAFFGV
ncbi:threonine synthase [Vampirovibrio sp.]|uniref:threonine synthase n=1 Tax=Vampirovibrio sp. TaxID=2717857 RepID=UPI0035937DF8